MALELDGDGSEGAGKKSEEGRGVMGLDAAAVVDAWAALVRVVGAVMRSSSALLCDVCALTLLDVRTTEGPRLGALLVIVLGFTVLAGSLRSAFAGSSSSAKAE